MDNKTMPYLSDKEREKVEKFCNDTVMFNAVKKALLEPIYFDGTLQSDTDPDAMKNWALNIANQVAGSQSTHEEAGKRLMAVSEGVQLVEVAIQKLQKVRTEEEAKKEVKTEDKGNEAV